MQIKNNLSNNLKKSWIIATVKFAVLTGCLYFIASKMREQSFSVYEIEFQPNTYLVIILVFLLMPLNWMLEAYRWKLSVNQFEEITLKNALEVVLSGLALNWILPFTSGDFIARIAGQKNKYKSSASVVLNRGIMMTFTLLIGLYGISFITGEVKLNASLIVGVLFGLAILLSVFKKAIHQFFSFFKQLSVQLLTRLILLSFLRYFVFVFQFYLLLQVFQPQLGFQIIIAGIGWIFFVRSVFPMLLGGIGVREVSGIFFFQSYTSDLASVIIPVFLVWIINTVVPTLFGLVVIAFSKQSDFGFSPNPTN